LALIIDISGTNDRKSKGGSLIWNKFSKRIDNDIHEKKIFFMVDK